jgi:hypothetical protein
MKLQYFNFETQYRQFYIEDMDHIQKGNASLPEFWSDDAFADRLAITNGVLGVGTQSYGNIKGEIEVLEKPEMNIDYKKYDHIVEGGMNLKSGELQILDCPNNNLELSLQLNPGKYRVRIYSSNLASVKEPDLADDTDDDYYRIELWKSDDMDRKVLKYYKEY